MANSQYDILEYRCVIKPEHTELFVLITNPTDFLPIGGWRKKVIDASVPSLDVLMAAMINQDYLSWQRIGPDEGTQWQQDRILELERKVMEQARMLAELMVRGRDV